MFINHNTKPNSQLLFQFFHKFDIHLSFFFSRDILLDLHKYFIIRNHLHILKNIGFKSSYLTAIQKTSHTKQKWPLLNLVRQLFKACGYHLKPERVCNGYSKDGKKLFKRFFRIEKIPEKKEENANNSEVKIKNEIIAEKNLQELEDANQEPNQQEKTQKEEIKEIVINE